MTELIIYLALSIISLMIFTFSYHRQGKSAEKKWLLSQLKSPNIDNQEPYINALRDLELNHHFSFKTVLLVTVLIVPATFVIDYLFFHEIPIEQRTSMQSEQQAPDLNTAIKQLEQKLADDPNDLEGQLLYGRSMMSLRNFAVAAEAYQQANRIKPNDANILTELAEAIAFRNNTGSFLGEPEALLQQAIELDPKNQKAMWLQGIVHFQNQKFALAEQVWTDLLPLVGSENVKSTIIKQINEARASLDKPALSFDQTPAASQLSYFVVVKASESVKMIDLPDQARLFIFAQQVDGPPMPIAAVPMTPPFAWPVSFRLNDQNSLNPQRKLSQFKELKFTAKLSLTGSATPDETDIKSDVIITSSNNSNIQLTLNQ